MRSLNKESIIAIYVLFVGHMSANPKGDLLLEHFKIYDILVKIVETHRDVAFIKLCVSTLNYYTSPKSRVVLECALCCRAPNPAYNELKIYIIKLILNLFRAHNLKFDAFFVVVLLKAMFTTLDHDGQSVSSLTKFFIEQVLELIVNALEYIFNLRPDLLDRVDSDNMIKTVDEVLIKFCANPWLNRSRLIRTKLEFLIYRMKMSEAKLAKILRAQVQIIKKIVFNFLYYKLTLKRLKVCLKTGMKPKKINATST